MVQFIQIQLFKEKIDKGAESAVIQWEDKRQRIRFAKVALSYGNRSYFICPCCGGNCLKLYLYKDLFRCRNCCPENSYRGIQNTTQGGDAFIAYKMERFAEKVGIGAFEYPFDYLQHPCPKQKHHSKWDRNLSILQAMENMRSQSIFFKKIWNTKTIRSVENGKNSYLKCSLPKLKQYFYPFDNGV